MGSSESSVQAYKEKAVQVKDQTVEKVTEGKVDTVETNARYLAYAARLKAVMVKSSRYLAYTSDVGEAFRPISHPLMVTAAYGVSWAYLFGDVGYEGYKASYIAGLPNGTVGVMMFKRAIFQGLASMALPAFTIHSVVRYSAKAFKNSANASLRTWGPTVSGLAVVPLLPFLFDHPVEYAVDKVFEKVEELTMGEKETPAVVGGNKKEL